MPKHPTTPTIYHHRDLDTVFQARAAVLTTGVADINRFREPHDRAPNVAPRRGDFNTLGLLTITAWLLLVGEDDTTGEAMRALWTADGLTDTEMIFIGLGDIRYTDNRICTVHSNATAWNTEYQRLDDLWQTLNVRRGLLRCYLTGDRDLDGEPPTD